MNFSKALVYSELLDYDFRSSSFKDAKKNKTIYLPQGLYSNLSHTLEVAKYIFLLPTSFPPLSSPPIQPLFVYSVQGTELAL